MTLAAGGARQRAAQKGKGATTAACEEGGRHMRKSSEGAAPAVVGGARQRAAQKGKGAMTTAREEGGRHVRGSSGVDMGKRTGAQARMD